MNRYFIAYTMPAASSVCLDGWMDGQEDLIYLYACNVYVHMCVVIKLSLLLLLICFANVINCMLHVQTHYANGQISRQIAK
jgi:hypothetical protein